MATDPQYITREDCLQHRQAIREEMIRRDSDRKGDLQELRAWMVRVEASVKALPREFEDVQDKKFDRLYQAIGLLILTVASAAILAWIGLPGG